MSSAVVTAEDTRVITYTSRWNSVTEANRGVKESPSRKAKRICTPVWVTRSSWSSSWKLRSARCIGPSPRCSAFQPSPRCRYPRPGAGTVPEDSTCIDLPTIPYLPTRGPRPCGAHSRLPDRVKRKPAPTGHQGAGPRGPAGIRGHAHRERQQRLEKASMTHRAATERHFLSRLDDPDLRKPGELARDYAAESSIIRCLPEPVPG